MPEYRMLLSPGVGWHGFDDNDVIAVVPSNRPLGKKEAIFKQTVVSDPASLSECRYKYESQLQKCVLCGQLVPRGWLQWHKHGEIILIIYLKVSEVNGTFQVGEPFSTTGSGCIGIITAISGTDFTIKFDAATFIWPVVDEQILGDTSGADAFIDVVTTLDTAIDVIKFRQWHWDPVTQTFLDKQPGSGLVWLDDDNKREFHPYTLYKVETGEDHPDLGLDPEFDPPT